MKSLYHANLRAISYWYNWNQKHENPVSHLYLTHDVTLLVWTMFESSTSTLCNWRNIHGLNDWCYDLASPFQPLSYLLLFQIFINGAVWIGFVLRFRETFVLFRFCLMILEEWFNLVFILTKPNLTHCLSVSYNYNKEDNITNLLITVE